MRTGFTDARVLMYSHDTFGLGHLRRCRAIAHALVEAYSGLTVLIVSGASIAGTFDYRSRVDFVKIPSVIKLRNGEYTSLSVHIDVKDTLKMRRSIIRHTAETFEPDIFITDKEPMGLRGELEETLDYLGTQGTHLVLGLREVMDAPHLLDAEWKRNDVMNKIDTHYDNVWVYGPPDFHDPLDGLDVPAAVRAKMQYTGFLKRTADRAHVIANRPDGEYILVTTGGGGDGFDLVQAVLAAYRSDSGLTHRALIVLGPYMPADQRATLTKAAEGLDRIELIQFEARFEELMAGAIAVVSMGGYNTFCEILSFDKPALILPRVMPRQEQLIRTRRASDLGLVDMMTPDEADDPSRLAAMLRSLPDRPAPSRAGGTMQMDGLDNIAATVGDWLGTRTGNIARVGG